MALSRKFLTALGIEPEKIDEIIEAHSATVDGLKEEINRYKADAESLPTVKTELETAQKELETLKDAAEKNGEGVYKKQYEDLKKEYDDYKADQEAKELLAKKTNAYRNLLKEIGVSEKRLDTILKVSKFDEIELDDKENIKDSDKLKESLKTEWSDFITKKEQQGANTATPPAGGNAGNKNEGRAAQLAAQYHDNRYGANKEG